ncbi:non-heme iron oxygenase ferredoxin subunit [Nesterenkonia lutea]|uniref:3-phenylpropionate/trans-cinnamate dioxygenase ferredoxin subunit n=1 Tax=Nesterenkonia lutea TaxID=272919 RepID=A0ABR9JH92_9MICC|nr:non-heme iron oxygenase ferredoxin subunit [Nesterenkonia lutea]MBE1524847.1 3-phenylpropionate/trans-cinnamate dioxygenase ferredoxin subunit [Nesterenkonia lutea]
MASSEALPPVDLGPAARYPEGEVFRVPAETTGWNDDIAVVHAEDGSFYALDDTCSHEAVSLSDGYVEEDTLECPMHASAFCLRTGAPETLPALTPVKTHRISFDADRLILHPGTPRPAEQ